MKRGISKDEGGVSKTEEEKRDLKCSSPYCVHFVQTSEIKA
jgi:hypothetical protein